MTRAFPHPEDTHNGEAAEKQHEYDLFVIGGGSGGVRASRTAAEFGAKVRNLTYQTNLKPLIWQNLAVMALSTMALSGS